MTVTIQHKRGTAAQWTTANPVLAEGEIGYETDTLAYKIGDGTTTWTALAYRTLTGVFAGAQTLSTVADPSVPPEGQMRLYANSVAGRAMPKVMGPSGLDTPLQASIWGNGIVTLSSNTTTSFSVIGGPAPTVVGTVSTPLPSAGVSLMNATRRTRIVSAATSNSASEVRFSLMPFYRGEAFGSQVAGGFFLTQRFGVSATVALQRTIVGAVGSSAAIAVTQNPSALTNCIFMGNDSADLNMQIMHNDASGTCTKIDLGSGFPANTVDAMYGVIFFCKPNGAEVGYRAVRLDTGVVVSGTITTDLPAKSTMLYWHAYANNGGTIAAVQLEVMRMYLETDY